MDTNSFDLSHVSTLQILKICFKNSHHEILFLDKSEINLIKRFICYGKIAK